MDRCRLEGDVRPRLQLILRDDNSNDDMVMVMWDNNNDDMVMVRRKERKEQSMVLMVEK